jgi:hypothetical protein
MFQVIPAPFDAIVRLPAWNVQYFLSLQYYWESESTIYFLNKPKRLTGAKNCNITPATENTCRNDLYKTIINGNYLFAG